MKDIDQEFFEQCVKESKSCKEALNKMGYQLKNTTNVCKSTRAIFRDLCKKYNVDTSHFLKREGIKKGTTQTQSRRKIYLCNECGCKISNTNESGLCKQCKELKKINDWITSGVLPIKATTSIRGSIRNYIFDSQGGCCKICGINNEWNNKELKFILDHIDGNAANNARDNLRLICPNCDSQLDTYKSKNKNSARNRKKYTQLMAD